MRGEKRKHCEGKAPQMAEPAIQALYQPRGSFQYRRPAQQRQPASRRVEDNLELNTNLTNIFCVIKDRNMVGDPELPKRPPRDVDRNKWCEYHRTVGHDTDDYNNLKLEIEKLIRVGHLRHFVQRSDC